MKLTRVNELTLALFGILGGLCLLIAVGLFATGCAAARNEVTHRSIREAIDPATGKVIGRETVEDTAKTDGHTFADGKNSIAQLSAGQTPKGGQRIGLKGQEQESTSELVDSLAKLFEGLVEAGAKGAAKAAVPVPTK